MKISTVNIRQFEVDLKRLNLKTARPQIAFEKERFELIDPDERIQKYILRDYSSKTGLIKNDVAEGPISDVFSDKFLVVLNKQNFDVKKELDSSWQRKYFTKIPYIEEQLVKEEHIKNFNLILLGANYQTQLIKNMIDKLPIKDNGDVMGFRGKQYKKKGLYLSFVYPNVLNPKKYLFFLYIDKLNKKVLDRDFTNENTHDFEVYNIEKSTPKMINEGVFNVFWE